MIALQDKKICTAGLEPTTGGRNMRKATVKIRRNPPRHQTDSIQKHQTEKEKNIKYN